MKKINVKILFLGLVITASIITLNSCTEKMQSNNSFSDMELRNTVNNNNQPFDMCSCIESNFPVEELSDIEIAGLNQMREEEKLARDVYLTLFTSWNQKVFDNISKAEQRHMDAILCLLNKYDIPDPVENNDIGVFTDDDIQSLYNTLIEQGNQSLVSALTVGAIIEDLDIYDLIEISGKIDNQDILAVFNELTKGSRNHMRAFVSQLSLQNESYSPQYITTDLFNSIINSGMERGGSICNNSGNSNNGNKGHKGQNGNGTCDGNRNGNNNNGNGNGGNGNG